MLPHSHARLVGTTGRGLHLMHFRRIPVTVGLRQLVVTEIRLDVGLTPCGFRIGLDGMMQRLPVHAAGGAGRCRRTKACQAATALMELERPALEDQKRECDVMCGFFHKSCQWRKPHGAINGTIWRQPVRRPSDSAIVCLRNFDCFQCPLPVSSLVPGIYNNSLINGSIKT